MDIPVVMAHECRGTTAVLPTAVRGTTIRPTGTRIPIPGIREPKSAVSTTPVIELMPVLTEGFRPMSNNAYVPENGTRRTWGRSGETFLFDF